MNLPKIAEEVAENQAQAMDNWLKPFIARYLPPDLPISRLYDANSTSQQTDVAEIIGILKEKGITIEQHQTLEPLTYLYKLVENGKVISELKYKVNLFPSKLQ